VTNAERTNVKVYEALMAVRSTKADAPATTVTAADSYWKQRNRGYTDQGRADVKNPGAEMSYDEKEKALEDMKGPAPKAPEEKDPRYGYKLPLTSGLVTAAAQLSHGPDASQGDNVENAIEFIKANGSDMDDYSVQQLREALTSAGYTQQVADDAITELLGQEALQALATPVKVLLK
jgi:hypothetical protein